jgi:hypothetical protein
VSGSLITNLVARLMDWSRSFIIAPLPVLTSRIKESKPSAAFFEMIEATNYKTTILLTPQTDNMAMRSIMQYQFSLPTMRLSLSTVAVVSRIE